MPDVFRLFKRLFARCTSRVGSSITDRFASETLRFRLAVSLGFTFVAVGFLVLGPGARLGVAQSVFGFFGMQQPEAPQPYYATSAGNDVYQGGGRRHHARRRDRARLQQAVDKPVTLARKSVCVRTCDGFAFPVGNYYGDGDRATHEAACRSECPGARTSLYVLPAGADSLAEATQVGTGRTYSQMPYAFHYTTFVDESCSCHPPEGGSRSLLRDFTLRRGDAVMTSAGMKIFHGGTGFPFKNTAFVALSKSRDIRRADRNSLRAIERASLAVPATVLAAKPVTKPAAISRNTTKGLEHQAKN